jgi:hypothetical protein
VINVDRNPSYPRAVAELKPPVNSAVVADADPFDFSITSSNRITEP